MLWRDLLGISTWMVSGSKVNLGVGISAVVKASAARKAAEDSATSIRSRPSILPGNAANGLGRVQGQVLGIGRAQLMIMDDCYNIK